MNHLLQTANSGNTNITNDTDGSVLSGTINIRYLIIVSTDMHHDNRDSI